MYNLVRRFLKINKIQKNQSIIPLFLSPAYYLLSVNNYFVQKLLLAIFGTEGYFQGI